MIELSFKGLTSCMKSYQCSALRDGPLEKLWGGGKGNFRAAGIFFRYQIPCMNFFRP